MDPSIIPYRNWDLLCFITVVATDDAASHLASILDFDFPIVPIFYAETAVLHLPSHVL